MKKIIFMLALGMGAVSPLMSAESAEEKKYSAQIGIMQSWFVKQDVVDNSFGSTDTDNFFDDSSVGLNVKFNYYVDEIFAVGFGHNTVTFDEDSADASGRIDDMEVSATFLSFEFSGDGDEFQSYGSFEIGASDMEDVDVHLTGFAPLNMYEDDSDVYWSAGAGIKYHIDDQWFLDLGYRYRDYGTLKANRIFSGFFEDMDVTTSNIDFSIGVKF